MRIYANIWIFNCGIWFYILPTLVVRTSVGANAIFGFSSYTNMCQYWNVVPLLTWELVIVQTY